MRVHYVSPVLASQSELYISIWRHHQRASHEPHLHHLLLPLDPHDASAPTVSCTVCGREPAEAALPARGRDFFAERRSWVCHAVAIKNYGSEHWEHDFELTFVSESII